VEQARGSQVVAALLALIRQSAPGLTDETLAWAIDQYTTEELLRYPELGPAEVVELRRWARAHRRAGWVRL
jgi:hypothetical protein